MRISVIFVSLLFLGALGAGGVWYRYMQSPLRDAAYRVCHEAGGEWVYDASVPLCLIDGELMTFVDDAYIGVEMARSVETARRAVSTACENTVIDETYTGPVSAVDFASWPDARRYRTAISEDVARGVNFAGAYVVSTWGCGKRQHDACVGHAIVDARDGRIVLYGVEGERAGEFSLYSTAFSVVLPDGTIRSWVGTARDVQECSI